MAVVTTNQRDAVLEAVRAMYTEVATAPHREFHFPTGRRACEYVGYPATQLDATLPAALESFAGVGYPFRAQVIRPADVVLDIGSGSGTDVLIASRLVGSQGRVIGLDMTAAMREKLQANLALAGATNVAVLDGNAEAIPLPDGAVTVVTSNGVLNLVPDKAAATRELARVLSPGGRLQLADIVVDSVPSAACRAQAQLWAQCIVGATSESEYLALLRAAGLHDVEVLVRQDYFAGSSSDETRRVAHSFGAHAVVIRARKPCG